MSAHIENPPAPPQTLQKGEVLAIGMYSGVVAAVGSDWLELAAGWQGQSDVRSKQREDNAQTKRIRTAGTKPGGDPKGEGKERTHRVDDLKVGDVVRLMTWKTQDGIEWSVEITITRHPGGKIPPQWGDPFVGTEHAFHLREQAEQDWEEKGIPIPKKYLNPQGRAPWTNPPYPPEAPMPRPASARP